MRWVLRRTVGCWSGGTPVQLLSSVDEEAVLVRPWPAASTLRVPVVDLVRRRRRREVPRHIENAALPVYVSATASAGVLDAAKYIGIDDLEAEVAAAYRRAGGRHALPNWFAGPRALREGQLSVLLRQDVVAVVERLPTESRHVRPLRVTEVVQRKKRPRPRVQPRRAV